jgi:hypothetical protein
MGQYVQPSSCTKPSHPHQPWASNPASAIDTLELVDFKRPRLKQGRPTQPRASKSLQARYCPLQQLARNLQSDIPSRTSGYSDPTHTRAAMSASAAPPPAAPTRRPRNSALSAFYSLPAADRSAPSSAPAAAAVAAAAAATSSATAPPGAADLIARAPLSELLTSAAALRARRDAARQAQRTAVSRVYARLSDAAELSARAGAVAAAGAPAVDAARDVAAAVAEVDGVLAPARAMVDELEDARKVELLRAAAGLLERDVEEQYREVVDLCLDPCGARERLLRSCLRYAALRGVFERCCAVEGGGFSETVAGVERAVRRVRDDLRERMAEGGAGVDGLDLLHVVRVRLLLGDEAAELKLAFLRASEMNVSGAGVSAAAAEAASGSGLSRAGLELAFAERETMPALLNTCTIYYGIFVEGAEAKVGAANVEEFTTWLAQVMENVVGERVRKGFELGGSATARWQDLMHNSPSGSLDSPFAKHDGAGEVHIDILQGLGTEAEAVRFREQLESLLAAGCRTKSEAVSATGVHDILRELCDELRLSATSVTLQRAKSHVTGRASSILARDYARSSSGRIASDVAGLLDLVKSGQESVNGVIAGLGGDPAVLARLAAEYVSERIDEVESRGSGRSSAGDEGLSRMLLSGAVIADALGNISGSRSEDLTNELRELRIQLLHSYCLRVSEEVTDVMEASVATLASGHASPAPYSSVGAQVSAGGCRAVAMLQRARRDVVAILSATPHLSVAFGEDDEVLDEGGILQRIARGWVCALREVTLMDVASVHAVQVDAAALESVTSFNDAFDIVPRAAVERCVATDIRLLSSGDVARRVAATAELS